MSENLDKVTTTYKECVFHISSLLSNKTVYLYISLSSFNISNTWGSRFKFSSDDVYDLMD